MAVLSDPSDWDLSGVRYDKGMVVLWPLDVKIRERKNDFKPLENLFRQINADNQPLTLARFKTQVAAVAGSPLDGWIDRYVTTEACQRLPGDTEAYGTTTPTLADYAGNDSVIGIDDLSEIVRDWVSGDLLLEFLNRAIRVWAGEQPVDDSLEDLSIANVVRPF